MYLYMYKQQNVFANPSACPLRVVQSEWHVGIYVSNDF